MQNSSDQNLPVSSQQQDTVLSRARNDLSLLKSRQELIDKENAQLIAAAVSTSHKLHAHDRQRLKVVIDHQEMAQEKESIRINFLEGLVNIDENISRALDDEPLPVKLEEAKQACTKEQNELKILFKTKCSEVSEVQTILCTAIGNWERAVSRLEESTAKEASTHPEMVEAARSRDSEIQAEADKEAHEARVLTELTKNLEDFDKRKEELRQQLTERIQAVRKERATKTATHATSASAKAQLEAQAQRYDKLLEKWGTFAGAVAQPTDRDDLLHFKLMVRAAIPEGRTWSQGVPFTSQPYLLAIQLDNDLLLPISASLTPEVPAIDLDPLLEEAGAALHPVPFMVSKVYCLLVQHAVRQMLFEDISMTYPIVPVSDNASTIRAVLPNRMEAEVKLPNTWPKKGNARLLSVQAPMSNVAGLEVAVAAVQRRYPHGVPDLMALLDEVAEAVKGL